MCRTMRPEGCARREMNVSEVCWVLNQTRSPKTSTNWTFISAVVTLQITAQRQSQLVEKWKRCDWHHQQFSFLSRLICSSVDFCRHIFFIFFMALHHNNRLLRTEGGGTPSFRSKRLFSWEQSPKQKVENHLCRPHFSFWRAAGTEKVWLGRTWPGV